MFTDGGMSPADLAAVTRDNDGFGGGNGAWWLLIILFAIFGWGGNGYGWGGRGVSGSSGVADNYVLASDFATIQRQLSDGFSSVERKGDAINNGLCDGFYAQNTTMLNGFSGVNQNIANGFSTAELARTNATTNILQSINGIGSQLQQCCCDAKYENLVNANNTQNAINSGFCSTNFNNQNNTRDIIANQDANTRAIIERLDAQLVAAKDEKIAELNQQVQALNLAASQSAQNSYLIGQLRPSPIPAYTVQNPYCNCNCGNTLAYGTTIV